MDNEKQGKSSEIAGRNFVLNETDQNDSISQGIMETYNQVNDMYSQHSHKAFADTAKGKHHLKEK